MPPCQTYAPLRIYNAELKVGPVVLLLYGCEESRDVERFLGFKSIDSAASVCTDSVMAWVASAVAAKQLINICSFVTMSTMRLDWATQISRTKGNEKERDLPPLLYILV